MEKLNSTLNAVKSLRSSVRHCFEQLGDGTTAEQSEESRTKFLVEFQENYSNINQQLRYVLWRTIGSSKRFSSIMFNVFMFSLMQRS